MGTSLETILAALIAYQNGARRDDREGERHGHARTAGDDLALTIGAYLHEHGLTVPTPHVCNTPYDGTRHPEYHGQPCLLAPNHHGGVHLIETPHGIIEWVGR